MPRTLPGNPGVLAEFDAADRLPRRDWFRSAPPRRVQLSVIAKASYASLAGRTIVAVGVLLGIPLVLVGLMGMARDPLNAVIAAGGATFALVFIGIPVVPAIRLARSMRDGLLDRAVVVQDVGMVDPRRRGLAIRDPLGRDVPYDPALSWTNVLRPGLLLDVLVDPDNRRVTWILGPSELVSEPDEREGSPIEDTAVSADAASSRTMPGR